MGETLTIGELEFKWELGNQGPNYFLSLFVTKPRLLKFSNEFTPKNLEDISQSKFASGEFVGMIRAALRKGSPRLSVAYSFVENAENFQLNYLEPLNKPQKGDSLVLIITVKSEFSDASTRFYLPLKFQKPEVEEMVAFMNMNQPASNIKSSEDKQQIAALTHEISDLKKAIELLQGDLSYWKSNSNRISKLEENQNQHTLTQLKSDVDSHSKSIDKLQKDALVPLPAPVAPVQHVNYGHGPVIFAQLLNGTLSANGGYWTWNEVVAMPAGHFMLSTSSYTNDTLTVLQPGLYEFKILVTTSSTYNCYSDLYKNGSAIARFYTSSCGQYYHSYNINNIYQCNLNDRFQVYTYYTSGSPLNGKPNNYFTVLKLGTTQQY
eukprot:Phypoly_transcript_10983.p1 GENE.Phypoly_transcript_10983~~Phypoly_transcript_10983.p1  ORF type:complete len:397 (+),score=48.73 Phypoly_transcript_10983:59-1192(+)